ncbi:uncharacterized protein LOC128859751 [Anastrepha ludens]|uniref:uncharacterized protein LOC128859751 n=1 Tax=Anastrepha ludens TaxID=28586 RepID=UPI0023AE8362|nr:uncharacterized protein LOC128859751 [Anastrepha ludens]
MANSRQHAHSVGKRAFWTEFFALYESLPALWDLNDPSYKDKQSRAHGYEILVMKMREIDPSACREDVLRKINIFRTNYRRECTRIKASNRMGKMYTTSLWYFHMLNFLHSQEFRKDRRRMPNEEKKILRRMGSKTTPLHSEIDTVNSNVSDSSQTLPDNSSEYKHQLAKYECITANRNESEEYLEAVQYADENSFQQQFQKQFHTPIYEETKVDAETFHEISNIDDTSHIQDDTLEELEPVELPEQLIKFRKHTKTPIISIKSDPKQRVKRQSRPSRAISEVSNILAKSWAIQYEEMSQEQRIYARKAISEILFQGCLGNLGRQRSIQPKTNTSEAVVSSQYEQANIMEDHSATDTVDEEKLLYMDDDSETYVYADGDTAVQLQEYMH